MSMYLCDATCPSNEQLAQRIQDGDPEAASLLLSQNEGYLTMLATSYCEQFSQDHVVLLLRPDERAASWTRSLRVSEL